MLHHRLDITCNNKGQVLLASVIVVGIISLVAAGSFILLNINALRGTVIAQQSSEGAALNNGCAEKALLMIRRVSGYTGSDNLTLAGKTCYFTVADLGGGNRLIDISSTIANVVKKTEIRLAVEPTGGITIQSWKDVP